MMDQVKVMVDEQTKNTLRQLQAAFADLLSPLEKLNALGQGGAGQEEIAKLARDVRNVGDDVQDGLGDLVRKVSSVAAAQDALYARIAAVAESLKGVEAKLDGLADAIEKKLTSVPVAPVQNETAEVKQVAKTAKAPAKKPGKPVSAKAAKPVAK